MRAIVLLADLKESRKKEGRNAVGQQVRESLRDVSERFDEHLVTAFELQRGIDEFGGVLEETAPCGQILVDLWKALHPHAVRFSLAEGSLDVVPDTADPSIHAFDGPALHLASESLDDMDSEGKLVTINAADRELDPTVDDLANLLYFRLLDWTPRQLEVYEAYSDMGSQARVAAHFGITQPTVSETLQSVRTTFMRKALDRAAGKISETIGGST